MGQQISAVNTATPASMRRHVGWKEGWAEVRSRLDEKILPALAQEGWMNHRKPLFSVKEISHLHCVVYNLSTQSSPYNWSKNLYEEYGRTMSGYLSDYFLPKLQSSLPGSNASASHIFFAEQLLLAQRDLQRINRYMHKFFRYLEKHYIPHSGLQLLQAVSEQCFSNTIVGPLQEQITMTMLELTLNVFETNNRQMKTLTSGVAKMLLELARSHSADNNELGAWNRFIRTIQSTSNSEAREPSFVISGITLSPDLCDAVDRKLITHLSSLEIHRCPMEHEETLARVVTFLANENQKLKRLTMSRARLDDAMLLEVVRALEAAKTASGFDSLLELSVPHNLFGNTSFTTLLRLGRSFGPLKKIDFSDNPRLLQGLGPESARPLSEGLSDRSISARSIDISRCGLRNLCVGNLVTTALELQHRTLDTLRLGCVEVSREDDGFWRIKLIRAESSVLNTILASHGVSNISSLSVDGDVSVDWQGLLSNATALLSLNLHGCKLNIEQITSLAAGLSAVPSLMQALVLSGCSITDTGLGRLLSGIASNGESLVKLDLSENKFVEGYTTLARILNSCPSLVSFHARGKGSQSRLPSISMDHVTQFLDQLRDHQHIQELTFPPSSCSSDVMREICSALAATRALTYLDLKWVHAEVPVGVLFSPTSAQLQKLKYFGFFETGREQLRDLLKSSTSLLKCEMFSPGGEVAERTELRKILERNRMIMVARRCTWSAVPVSRLCSVMETLGGIDNEATPLYVCIRGKHQFASSS